MPIQFAILGATGHIGKSLAAEIAKNDQYHLLLYARDPSAVEKHLANINYISANVDVLHIDLFGETYSDVVINAVGAGDPARLASLGPGIFRLTEEFDNRVLDYLYEFPKALYLNLSSGAVYGTGFAAPADISSRLSLKINDMPESQFYGIAKLQAEGKHRAHREFNIVDLRVFSYFSQFIDLSGQFFMAELTRSLVSSGVFVTDDSDFYRDYIVPADLMAIIQRCVEKWFSRRECPLNCAIDCYSLSPVGKFELIDAVTDNLGLRHVINKSLLTKATGGRKSQYYSRYQEAGKWGYVPHYSSTAGVLRELRARLDIPNQV